MNRIQSQSIQESSQNNESVVKKKKKENSSLNMNKNTYKITIMQ